MSIPIQVCGPLPLPTSREEGEEEEEEEVGEVRREAGEEEELRMDPERPVPHPMSRIRDG